MSIWNKILAGLIAVTSLVFFFFAARSLKTHQHWCESVKAHEDAIDKVQEQKLALLNGAADGTPGIKDLQAELFKLNLGRGRVWRNTQPQKVDPATGAVSVVTQQPAPDKDAQKTVVYAFQQADNQGPGAYLGSFTIVGADATGTNWQLQPTRAMFPQELGRLQQASRSPWALYEKMPMPDPDLMAQLQTPPGAKPKPAKLDLAAFEAQLTDYRQLFDNYYDDRSKFQELIDSATNDLKSLDDSIVLAKQQVKDLEADVQKFKTELAETTRQRDAVAAHLKRVTDKADELEAAIQAIIRWNKSAVAEIARIQLEATRKIDERTRRMAQAASRP